ncbi:MAG: hypothetical protein ACU83U_00425 [Gammaproteobacteria bacterium]
MKLIHRRLLNFTLLAIALAVILLIWQLNQYSLSHNAFYSGWLFFALLGTLLLLPLRKRIVGVSLGKVSTWVQLHIYIGFLAIAVFFLHVGWQIPEGLLKKLLYFLFILEALSGIFGLFISRLLPPYLARSGNVLYQDILARQQHIFGEVETLVKASLQQTDSTTIAEFFRRHLLDFLLKPRNFWHHILQSKQAIHALEQNIVNLQRYLNDDELKIIRRIQELLIEKDRLDYQYAGQSLLKRWLFVHIPLSYALLLFVLLHASLVYAYIGRL